MNKFLRISAIVAVALKVLVLTLILLSIPFRGLIDTYVYGYSAPMGNTLTAFPTVSFITWMLSAGCTIPLIFCCGNKKGGIWLELVVFGCLMVVLPAISMLVSPLYTQLLSHLTRAEQIAAYGVSNSIASFCAIPGNWGNAIAYAACGMSVVYKLINKNKEEMVSAEN